MELQSMKITGFFGRKEPVFIKFKNNKLIFVGENGLGKSTIMKILCYVLTCQFSELKKIVFDEIVIKLNNNIISFKKEDLEDKNDESNLTNHWNSDYRKHNWHISDDFSLEKTNNFLQCPQKSSQRCFIDYKDSNIYDEILSCFQYLNDNKRESEIENILQTFKNYNALKVTCQKLTTNITNEVGKVVVLYLPTYRRIEQELFGQARMDQKRLINNYEEYIGFGMRDVDDVFKNKQNELQKLFDTNNNRIRQEYYLDVLESKYNAFNPKRIRNLTPKDISKVIATISNEENIIKQIYDSINKLKEGKLTDNHDKIVGHFFLKLLDSVNEIEKKAKIIDDFTNVCNKYLINKELIRDDNFSINVELKDIELEDPTKHQIELSALSSGEKQIVSLFCKLYLQEDDKEYFVMIDEPELSISVGWQKMFLKDVIESPKCVGLFAVTHSPFIFSENGLDEYTMDLEDMAKMGDK